jgi:hypothetical protein
LEVNKSATLTAFSADLNCQPGYVSNATMNIKPGVWAVYASFSNSVCTTEEIFLGVYWQQVWAEKGYIGASMIQSCAGDGEDQSDVYLVVASAQAAVFENMTSPESQTSGVASEFRSLQLGSFYLNSTVLFCKPSYKLENALVYLNASNSILNISTNGISRSLPLSSMDMLKAFENSLSSASDVFIATSVIVGNTDSSSHDVFFQVLISISPEKDPARYMDAQNLEADTRSFFDATWTQLASQHLLSSGTYDLGTGTTSTKELRLVLRPLTIYLLDAGLMALAMCTSLMFFLRTTISGIPDLPNLGRVATILAASPELVESCSGESLEQLNPRLSNSVESRVAQETDNAFVTNDSSGANPQPKQRMIYWRPLAMSRWLQIVVLALPVAIVGTIEATYHISVKQQGLGEVSEHEYLHYTWTFVPALIMTLVKLLGQTMAFSIELLDSYLLLRLGNTPGNQTLFMDYLSGNSLSRCYRSIRSKRFAVFSISLVTLLSPFLTIVVSGLFDTQSIPKFVNTKFDVADRVDLTTLAAQGYTPNELLHTDAANLLIRQAIPYPAGSFENFVLPNPIIPSDLSDLDGIPSLFNASSISVNMTGLQMRIECEVMDQSEFVILNKSRDYGNFTHPVLAGCNCANGYAHLCDPSTILSLGFGIPDVEYSTNFYGNSGDDNSQQTGWLNASDWSGPALPPRSSHPCPDTTLVYGTRGSAPDYLLNLTGISCYANVVAVNANVSYDTLQRMITNVSVLSSSPPTSRYISLDINSVIAMNASSPYDKLAMATLNSSNSDPTEFFTPSNAPVIADRISRIYNTFATQLNSQALRNSTFAEGESHQVPAVLVDENRQRLVQNRLSTTILECLLAVIWLFTVAAILLSRTKNLLPENPCSIAAQARLFADSQLLNLIPGDIGHLTNKQLTRETPFVDHMFSLGWWDVDGKGTRRFGIDVGQSSFD